MILVSGLCLLCSGASPSAEPTATQREPSYYGNPLPPSTSVPQAWEALVQLHIKRQRTGAALGTPIKYLQLGFPPYPNITPPGVLMTTQLYDN